MSLISMIVVGALSGIGGALVALGVGGFLTVAFAKRPAGFHMDASVAEQRLKLYGHAYDAIQTGALLLIAAALQAH